jgi:hypothetical protein
MTDYGYIIQNQLIGLINNSSDKPVPIGPFNLVTYVFNKPQLPGIWYTHLVNRIGEGNFATIPDFVP